MTYSFRSFAATRLRKLADHMKPEASSLPASSIQPPHDKICPSTITPEHQQLQSDDQGSSYGTEDLQERVVQTAKEAWSKCDDGDDAAPALSRFSKNASQLTGLYNLGISEIPDTKREWTEEDIAALALARLISEHGVCPTRDMARQWIEDDMKLSRLATDRFDLIDAAAQIVPTQDPETGSEHGAISSQVM